MIRKTQVKHVEHLAGGKGTVKIEHIIDENELLGAARMYAKVTIPPGASIGVHTHTGETEPYYILEGVGDFRDNDGSVTPVVPGDCCLIKPGECHGMSNPYNADLVFMALIYYDIDHRG